MNTYHPALYIPYLGLYLTFLSRELDWLLTSGVWDVSRIHGTMVHEYLDAQDFIVATNLTAVQTFVDAFFLVVVFKRKREDMLLSTAEDTPEAASGLFSAE